MVPRDPRDTIWGDWQAKKLEKKSNPKPEKKKETCFLTKPKVARVFARFLGILWAQIRERWQTKEIKKSQP